RRPDARASARSRPAGARPRRRRVGARPTGPGAPGPRRTDAPRTPGAPEPDPRGIAGPPRRGPPARRPVPARPRRKQSPPGAASLSSDSRRNAEVPVEPATPTDLVASIFASFCGSRESIASTSAIRGRVQASRTRLPLLALVPLLPGLLALGVEAKKNAELSLGFIRRT